MGSLLIVSHRLKGSSASLGLNRAAKLAHLMEDLLQEVVGGTGRLTPKMVDALLTCTDGLRALRRRAETRQRFLGRVRQLCHGIAGSHARHERGDSPRRCRGNRLPSGSRFR